MMFIIGTMMPMPSMESSMILAMVGSLIGHIAFGLAVAKVIGSAYSIAKSGENEDI